MEAVNRWKILGLCCGAIWSQYYCYDTPASVHDHLSAYSGVHASDFPWFFNALYSAYSLPNFFLPLLFGWVVDKAAGGKMLMVLASLACGGQLLLLVGLLAHNPWTSISGRVLFGIGCESMGVVQTAILTHVFAGKEIAFALALNISCARLATMSNDIISPIVSSYMGTPAAFILGLLLAVAGLLCTVLLSRSLSRDYGITSESRTGESMWESTKQLNSRFWIVGMMCVAGYACILPFTSVFVAMKPAGLTQESASHLVSIVFLVCALLTPVFGRLIDKFGRVAWMSTAACLSLCLAHAMYSTHDNVMVMIALGIGYAAFVAAVWPMIPLTVDSTHVGLAYGIVTSIQNLGLTIVPLIIAVLRTFTGSYSPVRWLFLGLALVTTLLSIWLVQALHNGKMRESESFERLIAKPDRDQTAGLNHYGTSESL